MTYKGGLIAEWDIWSYGQGICQRKNIKKVVVMFRNNKDELCGIFIDNANWRE